MSPRQRRRNQPQFHGVLLVDKPSGMTSHDVVDVVRGLTRQREIGHTGTLDPAATGLLALCLGEATKAAEYLTKMNKIYEGCMKLGAVSNTYDGDGQIQPVAEASMVSLEELKAGADQFVGEIEQVPPPHSAKKIAGRRLYEYARAGEPIEVEPRRVNVLRFDIHSCVWPDAEFEVECGSGTYVRRLVHDLGQDLKCGAYLSRLRRTRVGHLNIENAVALDALKSNTEKLASSLWTLARTLEPWPKARIADQGLLLLKRGHALPVDWAPFEKETPPLNWLDHVLIVDAAGRTLAIARYVPAPSSPPPKALNDYRGPWFQPIKQFRAAL